MMRVKASAYAADMVFDYENTNRPIPLDPWRLNGTSQQARTPAAVGISSPVQQFPAQNQQGAPQERSRRICRYL